MVKIGDDRGGMNARARPLTLAAVLGLACAGVAEASVAPRLIETPAAVSGDALAVLYSGDGGWGPLDRGVAKVLADDGIRCWASIRCATS